MAALASEDAAEDVVMRAAAAVEEEEREEAQYLLRVVEDVRVVRTEVAETEAEMRIEIEIEMIPQIMTMAMMMAMIEVRDHRRLEDIIQNTIDQNVAAGESINRHKRQ